MEKLVEKLKAVDPVHKTLIGLGLFITLYFGVWSCQFWSFVAAPILFRIYLKWTTGMTQSKARLEGKVAIVTGANGGIGYETAKDLAKRGARVILACRSMDKAKKAADEIKSATGSKDIVIMKLDVSSMKSVREFAKKFLSDETRLDILVNNAGGQMMEKQITEENLEGNFAANHFGPFLLTNLLLDLMQKTGKARIVNVASLAHNVPRSLDVKNLNSATSFNSDLVYGQTKLANILFTRELDRRLRAGRITGITVNALHPGVIRTEFFKGMETIWYRSIMNRIFLLFSKTVLEGAQTQIHLAVAEDVEELSGLYWADCAETSISKLAQNTKLAKDLWEESARLVSLKPEETIV